MIPSCFSNTNNLTNTQTPQSLVTCVYQTQLCNSPTYLTLTWSKTLLSHSLTIHASDSFSITISLNSSNFSFFKTRPRPGSKSISLTHHNHIKLYWDFTQAEFTRNSAEPDSCFYLAIVWNTYTEFCLGDLQKDLTRRIRNARMRQVGDPVLLSRRDHVFGHRNYATTAMFMGSKHEIEIECGGGVLRVKVDGLVSLVVKRLAWKFRGHERIMIDGIDVEFYWDVFNWISNGSGAGAGGCGGGGRYGVFVFEVGDGGVWPGMVGPEKKWMKKSLSSFSPAIMLSSPSLSCSSVLQWAEESSDGGSRSSCSSSSTRSCGSNGGFSLLLYAWRSN